MVCTLNIIDPTLKYFLGKNTFDSYQEFRDLFNSKVLEGLIPIENRLEEVLNTTEGYVVLDTTFDTIDSLINHALGGLLDTNNPDVQFNKFIQTFELYKSKYETEPYISNDDIESDTSFINSLFNFYDNYPVTQEFKESDLYTRFKQAVEDLKQLLFDNRIEESEPELPTNESELYDSDNERAPYIYSKTVVYQSSTDEVLKGTDTLSIVRHKFSEEIERLMEQGRQFFIRLEKDGATNVQTLTQDELGQKNIPWGVIGVIYELVGNEYKRVYIENYDDQLDGTVSITTDVKKAVTLGANEVKGFTLTMPKLSEPQYNAVSPDVRVTFTQLRDSITADKPSGYYKINDVWSEYPVAAKWNKVNNKPINRESRIITLRQFLNGQPGDLRINSSTEGINYAGNLYVQFPNGKAVLDRTPLSDKWKERVYKLVSHEYGIDDEIQTVVDSLNKLLEFKGGDISFGKRGNRIIVKRKSKRTKVNDVWVYERIKEEVPLDQLFDLLDYARINVDKTYLENPDSFFPIVTDKGVKLGKVNWYDFYLDHHQTIARQVKIGNKYYFQPIRSLVFNLESEQKQKINEEAKRIENPKLGDIELIPNGFINTVDIIKNLQSIANETTGSTRDILNLLNALLDNKEVQSRLENSTVQFQTTLEKDNKGYSDDKEIFVNWNIVTNINLLADVLAHEIIHTLTSDWLVNNSSDPLYTELEELRKLAPDTIPEYNRRNIYELIASISNPKIAEELKKVKTKDKSLYDRIVDVIKQILDKVFGLEEFKKGQPNLYKELIVKLVEISTKEPQIKKEEKPKDEWEGFDLNNLEFDLGPLGYDENSLKVALGNEKPSFLKDIVNSLDTDLFQYIYENNKLSDFVTGELDFTTEFKLLYNNYLQFVRLNKDKIESKDKKFYMFIFANRELVLDYWLENTEALKVRVPKKGEQDPSAKQLNQNEDNDTDKLIQTNNDEETTEKQEELSNINSNEEINYNDKWTERTGTELSSLEGADKLARIFVKMIPKIERNEEGTVTYGQKEVDESINPNHYVRIGNTDRYIKFATNNLGRLDLCDYTPTWNSIAKVLSNKLSLEEMLNTIDNSPELVQSIPEIFVFRDRLRKPISTTTDAELYSKIETSFKRADVGVFIVMNNKGVLSLINESTDITNPAKRMFNTALVNSIQGKLNKYYKEESGKFQAKQWLEDLGIIKDGVVQIGNKNILKEMGLFLSPKTIWIDGDPKGNKTPEFKDFEEQFVMFLSQFEEVPVNLADFIIKGNKKVQGLNNWFKKLFALEHENRPLATTTMVTNAEGEKQSTLSVFNTILQYRKHYNESETVEQLNSLVERSKNDMFEHSLTKSVLFPEIVDEDGNLNTIRSNRKVRVDILSGWKSVVEGKASEGALTIDLPDGDWIRLNFVGMLKGGRIENTRAETASTSYTFTLDSWDTVFKKITPFGFSEIDGIWSRENNKVNLTPGSSVLRVWTNYLKGELTRIKKQGLPLDKTKFGLFQNILNDAEKKLLLGQLNNDINQVISVNQDVITNALNRFFQEEFGQYNKLFENEMGGISSIIGQYVLDLEGNQSKWTGDETIRNIIYGRDINGRGEKDLLNQYKLFFVINALTLHTEETILFQGDLSETPKYFKRAKGVQSTGTPLSKSEQLQQWVNKELEQYGFGTLVGKPFVVGQKYESATIVDDVKQSYYAKERILHQGYIESKKKYNELSGIKQTDKEIEEEAYKLLTPIDEKSGKEKGYSETNIGDGDGFINADHYFALLQLVGNINQNQIIGFKALQLDAKKNASRYGLGKDQVLTEEEEKIRQKGLKLISKGKAVFPKLKVTHRGNTEGNIVQKEIMDKFALFPLFPQFVHDKPAAKAAMLTMINEGIGYIKFESGTKIDNTGKTDFLKQVESGQVQISFEDSKHSLKSEYLREQVKTPNKVKDKNTFGTQFRKLITAIRNEDLRKRWEQLNQQFSEFTKKEVLGELGISESNGSWDFSKINKVKVAKVLLKEAKRRELPNNLKQYFDKYRKGHLSDNELTEVYKYFETSFGSQQIQSLLAGLIKKISIQKLKGAQLVQVSQSLFDRQVKVEGKTRDLGFYHIDNGKVKAAECKVAMMGDFRNLLNLEDVSKLLETKGWEDNELTRTQVLNELLQQDEWVNNHSDVLTIVGYRIPTQGFNSMEVMVIREFLPSFHGNTIVCPPEITTQSGTDYDYDKLSVILPSINEEGLLDNKGSKGVQNQMIKTASEMLLSVENYHRLITPNSNDIIFGVLKGKDGILAKLGISSEDPKFTKIITFLGNLSKFKAVKGKNLLGIAAVWNPFTVLIQNHKWLLNPNYNKEIGFGEKSKSINVEINPVLGGSLNSYEPNTISGTSKLEIISQLINVTVDMPSDDTFGQTIFSKDDFSALTYSISMLSYDFETAMYFFHQPIIYKFKSEYEKNRREGMSKNLSKLQALADVLGLEIPYGDFGPNFTQFEMGLYDQLSKFEKDIDVSKIKELDTVESAINKDYWNNKQQRAVLSHYFKLLDQSSSIRTVQSALNFDTSPDNNLHKTFERKVHYLDSISLGIVDQEKIDEIKQDSVISGLFVSDILESLADELFPILYSGANKNMFSEVSEQFGRNKEKAYQKLTNDYLLAILQIYGRYNNNSLYNVAKEFLIGNKKTYLARTAKELKESLAKKGISYRLLDVLLLDISTKRLPVVFNPQIFMGIENSPEDKDQITDELREMINSENPVLSEFAKNLCIVGLIQSGWSKSPVYFSDMLPEEFVSPIISNAFDQYNTLSKQEKQLFREQFVDNFTPQEGGTLGKKDTEFRTYLKEPHRLMNYRYESEEIKKKKEKLKEKTEVVQPEETQPVQQLRTEPKPTDLTKEEVKESGKKIVVPEGSNPNNLPIFETEDSIFLMNDDQQKAYNGIKSFILKQLQARDSGNTPVDFTEPLSQMYSGIIPQSMWDNMIGLIGKGGVGKAQPWYSKVYTPTGYKLMRDVQIGDEVISEKGIPIKVLDVFPQGIKDVYRITFDDGFYVDACGEHNWLVKTYKQRQRESNLKIKFGKIEDNYDVLTTNQIKESIYYDKKKIKELNYKMPINKSVLFVSNNNLVINPYLLGALIGDGGLTKGIRFTNIDPFILNKISTIIDKEFENLSLKQVSNTITYGITKKERKGNKNKLWEEIKKLGLNVKSDLKFIPKEYIYTSIENRINLLQGLMDTDGFIDNRGINCSYSTCSKQLAGDVAELVQSLGCLCRITFKKNKFKGSYTVTIRQTDDFDLCSLPRKQERIIPKTKYKNSRYIKSVMFIGQEEQKCILVDSDTHLYLTDNFTVTHNTTVVRKIIEDVREEYQKTNKYATLSVQYVAPTHNAVTMLQEALNLDSEDVGSVKTAASLVYRNQSADSENAEKGKPGDELLLLKSSVYVDQLNKGFITPISSNDIIVIDESSMIDKQFIEDLLFRFRDEHTTKMPIFLFMGDYRQLPPVSTDSDRSFKEGIVSATLFSDKQSDKHFELTQIMRSKDALFHTIFNSVGDQITQQRKDFNEGKEIKPFDFKPYDEASKGSSENLLVVTEKQVDAMIDDYAQILVDNDNPYEMFWVHYNKLTHANTQDLFKRIRTKYFEKRKEKIISDNIQTGDYIQYTGSLPLSTIPSSKRGIGSGTVKPTARLKIVEMGKEKVTLKEYPQLQRYFGNVEINTEFIVVHNRQNRLRFVTAFEKDIIKVGNYNKDTKRIEVSLTDASGKIHTISMSYPEFKKIEGTIKGLSKTLDTVFKPSYIGSTHTVQGASIKKVIVGDYNVRKNAPNIALRDMESSLYTALTRTSEKLIIIKPDQIQIDNNQEKFKLTKQPVEQTQQTEQTDMGQQDVQEVSVQQGQLDLFNQSKSDKQLINEYITKVSTGEIIPDWFRLKTPVNFDNIVKNESIPALVQSIKKRIVELSEKVEQYERDGTAQQVIDNVNNQIQGYGSLVYDLENLRKLPPLGYDENSVTQKCTNI